MAGPRYHVVDIGGSMAGAKSLRGGRGNVSETKPCLRLRIEDFFLYSFWGELIAQVAILLVVMFVVFGSAWLMSLIFGFKL